LKRSAIDVLRRGFENVVANWPLILIRVAEGVVLAMIVIGALIAAVVPVLVSAGLDRFDFGNPGSAAELFATFMVEHWLLLVYLLLLASLILAVMVAVHSFVEAGSARIYVDGEHVAGFRAFAMDRWLEGGRRGWWPVFWIYNLAWSVGGLIVVIPALIVIPLMFVVGDVGPRIVVGCAGLAFMVLLMIPTAIAMAIWTQKAIVICVARATGAVASLAAARREIKLDLGRHLGVALIVMVVSLAAASVVSSVSIPFSLGHHHGVSLSALFFAPVQLAMSVVQSAVSAAVGAWFLASFVALTEEK
jgi:hypothetical protein